MRIASQKHKTSTPQLVNIVHVKHAQLGKNRLQAAVGSHPIIQLQDMNSDLEKVSMLTRHRNSLITLLCSALFLCLSANSSATPLNLPDTPLNVAGSKTALVQLIVERDNKLFFEAYPTYQDINGDGVLDNKFKPDEIDYYGYFSSDFCYTHNGSYFSASSLGIDKKCTADPNSWSGDFLNYATMTRMDVMLRALYGGRRIIDTDSQTVLRRAFVPWTIHTWGVEYESESVDGYRLSDYTPLSQPTNGRRHHFATNNRVSLGDIPHLRIRENSNRRIWDWVDKNNTQGDGPSDEDLIVDVEVCAPGFISDACSLYPNGNHKPTGILHTYGENNAMYFSLLTGSFENNLQGGVLRKTMRSFTDEIDSFTGVYNSSEGIVHTLNAIQIPNDFRNGITAEMNDCGFISERIFDNGECSVWGNPIAEMMFEGMRYLAGAGAPTPMFYDDAADALSIDNELGLPTASWDDPYSADQPYGQCSSAYQLVISDPSPSFDGDQLPGSEFDTFKQSALGSMDVGSLADFISSQEPELPGLKFIGEANGVSDRAPSAKLVTTFATARGQSPEAAHREGSYYASSVAYYGHQNDVHPNVNGEQNVSNFTLALGSQIPTIKVKVGSNEVQIAPYGVTVNSACKIAGVPFAPIDSDVFAPVDAIVGFDVENASDTAGSFRVSFENMEQGGNNDMDTLVRYEYEVIGGEVDVTTTTLGSSGCFNQHLGFSISGTTADGIYLVVRDKVTNANNDEDFKLDVPAGQRAGSANWEDGQALPHVSAITFTPSSAPAAQTLESPLWYAAKWGGFRDANEDGIPQTAEWDSNGDGDPDNYFNAADPSLIEETLGNVFSSISASNNSLSASSVTGSSLTSDSRIFESNFNTGEWHSDLTSRGIDGFGNLADEIDWNVNTELANQIANSDRTILTYKPSTKTGIPFQWPSNEFSPLPTELDVEQVSALSTDPIAETPDALGETRLNYLRGDHVEGFRARQLPLGDIVNSAAQFVGPPGSRYPDDWGPGEPESSQPYSEFVARYSERQRAIYVGANDGMLHAFNAGEFNNGSYDVGNGEEIFAYVPSPVFEELPELSRLDYPHRFYVDATPRIADAFIGGQWRTILVGGLGKGGQGVYALDITDVSDIDESDAQATVLWEFTEKDDGHMGYSYTSPLITRMNNGRWAAIFGNGYNSSQSDGFEADNPLGAIFIVDLETGDLITKLFTHDGSDSIPNAINAPTAVDLDNDNKVDIVYASDTRGVVSKYNLSSTNDSQWARISDQMFFTIDREGTTLESNAEPVTTQMAVGSHPTGEGVLLYLATGKYLEPSDLVNDGALHRVYALWDRDPYVDPNLRATSRFPGRFVEQSITAEKVVFFDTDGDGIDESSAFVRESTQHEIDWSKHLGWFMNLEYITATGEQVVAQPILREGRIIFNTYIPIGDECTPESAGWLMALDAASGAMPETSIDLNGDGVFTPDEKLSGINSIGNPFSPPTIASGTNEDIILTSNPDGSGTSTSTLNSLGARGRVSWKELEP